VTDDARPDEATRRARNVTLHDVASRAGVSTSTVSRVFSSPSRISAPTVERVRRVASELGYVSNQAARALRTGRFHNLAMVVPDIANPFFPPLVRAIQNRAADLGYAVFLGDSDEQAEREMTLLTRLDGQVDGFILGGTRLDEAAVREFATTHSMVLLNRDVATVSRVLIDASTGVHDAVRHLARLGHRRIAYLAGPPESWSNQQRQSAARDAAESLGLPLDILELGRPTFESGRAAADRLLDTDATAAVAFDDVVAHGLLSGLHARGLTVPRDFSVIGCDDTLAVSTDPALTTISHSSEDAGAAIVDLLIALTGDPAAEPEKVLIPTRLVHRQTTAAPTRELDSAP
jgi:LacI family transcriptional regulator